MAETIALWYQATGIDARVIRLLLETHVEAQVNSVSGLTEYSMREYTFWERLRWLFTGILESK